jgi:hypothetical protein
MPKWKLRGAKAKSSDGYAVDVDGFFYPLLKTDQDIPREDMYDLFKSNFPLSRVDIHRIFQIHFLIRNSLVPVGSRREQDIDDQWSRTCLMKAVVLTRGDFASALELPTWVEWFCDEVKKRSCETYPNIYEIVTKVNLRPRLYAWSVPLRNEVNISALTRELLYRINVFLANVAYADRLRIRLDVESLKSQFLDYLLRYLLTSFDDLCYSKLPVARPFSFETMARANHITRVQVEFMLAHEYAHVVKQFPTTCTLTAVETACDDFAYSAVVDTIPDRRTVYMALSWLFQVVAFERLLGELLYFTGGEWCDQIDWSQRDTRTRDRTEQFLSEANRRTGHQAPAKEALGDFLSGQEMMGTALLESAKARLYELGPAGVRNLVDRIRGELRLPTVDEFLMRFPVYDQIMARRAEVDYEQKLAEIMARRGEEHD